ncbi:ubiquitin-like-conjugating enzyme ATG10 [Periophthalmus magnuspinnatus]|uniref:ubiquitin-like-conjugating enzyme ATG10 n=1 Tax=Periophthalmus magnuspinnatus TaxID=409849 RepID=UPI00145ACEF0|nr:ubiquitin-like-conjugating enzyme ATG10 [Periophthalmus magnuspinnatus]
MSCLHLDEDSFFECCQHLLKKSEELRDGWSWETVQGTREGYLRKTVLRSIVTGSKRNQEIDQEFEQTSVATPEEADDDADEGAVEINCPAAEGGSHLCFQFEFHVVFSSSYRTPVLYFRAFSLEGKSLSLEDVWSFIQPKLRLTSQDALLNTITQQEHPLLGQAFFMLHPCKTQDFMRPVLQTAQQENRAVNYVLTWLSVVAPLVGLDVPLEYCSDLRPGSKPD